MLSLLELKVDKIIDVFQQDKNTNKTPKKEGIQFQLDDFQIVFKILEEFL